MFIVFLFFYLVVEVVTFIWIDFSFLPSDILIDLVIAFAISSFVFLIKLRTLSIIYLSTLFLLIVLLFLVNSTMYSVYYDLFTLQQLQLAGEATDVMNADLISVWSIVASITMLITYTVSMVFLHRYLKKNSTVIQRYYPKAIACFLVSLILVFSFFAIDTNKINSFLVDSNVTTFKRSSFEKYGILGYYTKELEDIIEQGETNHANTSPVFYSEPTEYFGLLEGKNVITIMLESIQPFAINEVLTPNMYQLAQDGLYFENSYSENKTNVSELIAITGNYPSVSLFPDDYEYDFSYSLPSILATAGYRTSYFHDNVATFYVRGSLMPQVGFDYVYLHEELYPDEAIWRWNGDYTLDSVTMEKMLPNFTSEEPFYTFWASLSTHGPYNYGLGNIQLFEDMGYFAAIDQAEADGLWTNALEGADEVDVMRIRHYQAAVMDLDVAIGMMLYDLREKDLLNDTIIVLYGDHNVYYHNINLKMFDADENDFYNMEMYHNFFCIYNPELTQEYLIESGDDDTTVSKFVSPYTIVPTLMDLMGIQYDQNLFMGSSVFSDKEEVFYSLKLTGFFNENLYSSDGMEVIYNKEDYTMEELAQFIDQCEILRQKIGYINKYYISNREEIADE